jgi:1-acyl-sn-glycerol-3-phosphate acyltransferase
VQDAQSPWDRPEPLYRLVLGALDVVARCVFRLRVAHGERLPATGPALVVANHVSFLDPCLLAVAAHRYGRKVRFLALSSLLDVPVVGRVLRAGRTIPVARGGGATRMVEDACAALDAGQLVIVYPEGTIPRASTPATAKPGAGLLALTTSAPVLPAASWGVERGTRRLFRRRAAIVFGEPVDLSRWGGRVDRRAQLEAAAELLAAVRGLVPEAERLARARR